MQIRAIALVMVLACRAAAQQEMPATRPAKSPAELEADLSQLLSGATLEGSFTVGGSNRLANDKYTLGTVRKLQGNTWLISARIQYGGRDVMVPLNLPIEWAGDTPVIVVDDLTIPGLGTFSARVMFFAGHYSGYWKHGERGGVLFGVVRRAGATTQAKDATTRPAAP